MLCAGNKAQNAERKSTWRFCCWPPVAEKTGSRKPFGFLLGSQQPLNAEETARLTEDNAPASLTTVAIDPVSLKVFDDLLTMEDTAA
jgi:hypothetical protein